MKRLEFSLTDILYIGLGGMLGSLLRWLLGIGFEGMFPIPTVLVNILGAIALGILYASQHETHPKGKYLYMVGFCGSFTTVSLYAYESIQLLEAGHFFLAASNILLPVFLSLIFVAIVIPPIERAVARSHS